MSRKKKARIQKAFNKKLRMRQWDRIIKTHDKLIELLTAATELARAKNGTFAKGGVRAKNGTFAKGGVVVGEGSLEMIKVHKREPSYETSLFQCPPVAAPDGVQVSVTSNILSPDDLLRLDKLKERLRDAGMQI